MNLQQLSKDSGRCDAYFSVIQKKNPEKFKFIFAFDKNPSNSIKKYETYVLGLLCSLADAALDDRVNFKKASTIAGYSGTPQSTTQMVHHLCAVRSDMIGFNFNALKRYEKLLKAYTAIK